MGINSQDTAYGFGQLGSAYISTADQTFTPPTGMVVVSIISLDDATEFNVLTPDNTADTAFVGHTTVASGGIQGTMADGTMVAIPASQTFPAGTTIFGRWTSVQIDAGAVIVYFGY